MTCKHKNMKTLHEETGNRICLDCKAHWFRGKEYTRKEWDMFVEGWNDCKHVMPPKRDKTAYEVLCSDGKTRKAYSSSIGGWLVDHTQDWADGTLGGYEVTHWRDGDFYIDVEKHEEEPQRTEW